MKKVKNRSFSALIIAFAVMFGMIFYTVRYASDGEDWATFTADSQIVTGEGKLISRHRFGQKRSFACKGG